MYSTIFPSPWRPAFPKPFQIKEFLETNYPPVGGRALEVLRSFHFDLQVKNRNSIISPHPKLSKKVSTAPQGVVKSRAPRQSREEFVRLKAPGASPAAFYIPIKFQPEVLLEGRIRET